MNVAVKQKRLLKICCKAVGFDEMRARVIHKNRVIYREGFVMCIQECGPVKNFV